jgi:hypothetical protein
MGFLKLLMKMATAAAASHKRPIWLPLLLRIHWEKLPQCVLFENDYNHHNP